MTSGSLARMAAARPVFDAQDLARISAIGDHVRGYSDERHYSFFRTLFAQCDLRRVLICGVYFGRDIAFMIEAARRGGRRIAITGVDKFRDEACADWPPSHRGMSWEQAGFGPAPSLQAAAAGIAPFQGDTPVRLVRADDAAFMAGCRQVFDLIYLDTSHDYATVARQLAGALPLLAEGGLIAGDDYIDRPLWGVKQALRDHAPDHALFNGCVWMAAREHLALPAAAA